MGIIAEWSSNGRRDDGTHERGTETEWRKSDDNQQHTLFVLFLLAPQRKTDAAARPASPATKLTKLFLLAATRAASLVPRPPAAVTAPLRNDLPHLV